jgi:hypothetical protein
MTVHHLRRRPVTESSAVAAAPMNTVFGGFWAR